MVNLILAWPTTGATRIRLLIYSAVWLILYGCSSSTDTNSIIEERALTPESLVGFVWTLEETTNLEGLRFPPSPGTVFWLQFSEDGSFKGQINCRELTGTYILDEDSIRMITSDNNQPDCAVQNSPSSGPILFNVIDAVLDQGVSGKLTQQTKLRFSTPDGDRIDLYGIELPDDSIPLSIHVLESGDYTEHGLFNFEGELFSVFRNSEEFTDFYQSLYPIEFQTSAVVTPDVDFTQNLVVGAFMPRQPNGAARIDIQAVLEDDTALTLFVLYNASGCGFTTAGSGPYTLAVLDTTQVNIVVETRIAELALCNDQ